MVDRIGKARKLLALTALAVAALVFGGCDWAMFGAIPSLTHDSVDNAINSANVSTLQPLFTSSGEFGSPVESNGVVYAGGTQEGLWAFDANGVTSCSGSPNQCSPLWTGTTGAIDAGTSPAVANGIVSIISLAQQKLYAFDANGVTGCSGSPKVCQPLWTAHLGGAVGSPIVANGVVYVGGAQLLAFAANGVTSCSGSPKVCQPLWSSGLNSTDTTPAIANGVLYVLGVDAGGGKIFAYSATGTTNCSGTPTTCNPLWAGTISGNTTSNTSAPAVANGVVYAESGAGKLFAFDANGVTGCSGTPMTCSPLWTAALAGDPQYGSSPAVSKGIVYAPSSALQAFDANGVTGCSGSPKICAPLWSYSVSPYAASPSVANGLVYIGTASGGQSTGFNFDAFDANGHTDCAGTPAVCNPLWTGVATGPLTGSAAIANGRVFVTDNSFGLGLATHLYGWLLPPPTTFVALPSDGATVSGYQYLDAGASSGVTQVTFEFTGGKLNHAVIATATATTIGWLARWNSTTVANGTYTLQSVASYGTEVSGTSSPVTITVAN